MSSDKDKVAEWFELLNGCGKPIIVEGVKDRDSLRSCGISNDIFLLKKPIYAVVEEVASKATDVVVLTDLDRTGKQLYGKLFSDLQHRGVRIDNFFREFLFRNTKIRQIEGLHRYFQNLHSP